MSDHPGELEQLILFAILRLDEEDAYGVGIRREVRERTGRSVSSGGIYTILQRLEDRGLVSSSMADPTPRRGGRRKRLYRLTPQGAATLRRSWEAVSSMAEGVMGALSALEPAGPEGEAP